MKTIQSLFLVTFLTLVTLLLPSCQSQTGYVQISGLTMGTSYHITFEDSQQQATRLQQKIDQQLKLINQQMSTYIDDSELSLFNQSTSTECQKLSTSTLYVIKKALEVSAQTNGRFDVTVSPLISEWGFDKKQTNHVIPSDETIRELLKNIGYEKISIGNNCAQKGHPALSVNLSAIAKGFAVDHIAKLLADQSVNNYLVEIGGETASKGLSPSSREWVLAVEVPAQDQRKIQQRFSPNGLGVATSGDYRNYFEKDGVRFSHTIDPTTGKPITNELASVTVLHPETMLADAYATAFTVMGTKQTLEFANSNHIPVYLLVKTNSGFEAVFNDLFKSHMLPTNQTKG